jgi:hypothetical protein
LAARQLFFERARLFSRHCGRDVGGRAGLHAAWLSRRLVRQRDPALRRDGSGIVPDESADHGKLPGPETRCRASAPHQALALPEVAQAVPVYLATQAAWRSPETGAKRAIQLIGFDVESGCDALSGPGEDIGRAAAGGCGGFRCAFAPGTWRHVAKKLADHGPLEVQIGNRMMRLVGLVEIGPSFGAEWQSGDE